ncbi:hypothetical protein GCM10023194_74360 [Planotetraspora phitsanulokensis]|uniref:Uncharacterized protein n=1 Tax=Planotetraspora phitsanulokensis TaxID=575192 RepID=A0A8J3U6V3_9ACTN|nr:DUF6000 family protein [Planotetraspora phitsanulokensis]GII37064.1 hypothetical protein Pph01_20670 [Planotetraspora phitsanulokensis]
MRFPTPNDPEMVAAVEHYVVPGEGASRRYLNLLHGNFLELPGQERSQFGRDLATAARQISDEELALLLDSEWRSRLTAAWLIGIGRRTQFRDRLAEMLLNSELVYSGQGYCFAFARFADEFATAALVAYLDRYLPDPDYYYDQHWAMGALLHLDERLSTEHASHFLAPEGLWARSAMRDRDPAELKEEMDRLCAFAETISV